MYFGFWKNDKMDGKGLLFYVEGEIIYGYFLKNQMVGPAIFDSH